MCTVVDWYRGTGVLKLVMGYRVVQWYWASAGFHV